MCMCPRRDMIAVECLSEGLKRVGVIDQ